jgi:hypothetical protein
MLLIDDSPGEAGLFIMLRIWPFEVVVVVDEGCV